MQRGHRLVQQKPGFKQFSAYHGPKRPRRDKQKLGFRIDMWHANAHAKARSRDQTRSGQEQGRDERGMAKRDRQTGMTESTGQSMTRRGILAAFAATAVAAA